MHTLCDLVYCTGTPTPPISLCSLDPLSSCALTYPITVLITFRDSTLGFVRWSTIHRPPSTIHTPSCRLSRTPENPSGDRNALGSPFQHGQFLYFRHPACHILRASLPEGPLVSLVTSVVAGSTKPARGLNRAPPFDRNTNTFVCHDSKLEGHSPPRRQ